MALKRIRLDLARDRDFPTGASSGSAVACGGSGQFARTKSGVSSTSAVVAMVPDGRSTTI